MSSQKSIPKVLPVARERPSEYTHVLKRYSSELGHVFDSIFEAKNVVKESNISFLDVLTRCDRK